MAVLYTNNATTTLSAGITSGQTTLTVAAATGALFPAPASPDYFYVTLIDASNNIEIVKVTARSADTFTIVRAQEGTTARAFSSADKVELRVTAAGLANKLDKDTGGTLSGALTTVASATGGAGFNLPHGTAPTSPANGDIWSTTTGLFVRVNGATVGPLAPVSDTAYGAGWNGVVDVAPSKNAVYDQMELRAPLASPTLTGTPSAPTASTGTSTTQIATTGFVQQELAANAVQAVWVPAVSMKPRASNPPASGSTETTTNKVNFDTLDFDGTAAEYAQFDWLMPKRWNEGTVTAEFVWTAPGGTGNVVWGIQAVAISDDDVIDAAFGTAQTVTDAVTATTDMMRSAATSAMTVAGTPANSDLVKFQVYRDAANGSDTLNAIDAKLIGVNLYITTNARDDS